MPALMPRLNIFKINIACEIACIKVNIVSFCKKFQHVPDLIFSILK